MPQSYIARPKVIGPLVQEKKIFEGFLPYMGMAAIFVMWPRCPEHTFVPLTHGGSTWNMASIGPAVLEKKIFENGGWTTDNGVCLYYKLTKAKNRLYPKHCSWFRFFFSSSKFTQYTSEAFTKLNRNKHCFEHLGGYAQQNQQIDLSEDQIRRAFDDKWRIIFSEQFSIKNICCGYSLESSQRVIYNKYPQHMFFARGPLTWVLRIC